jgi:hypothetical protein
MFESLLPTALWIARLSCSASATEPAPSLEKLRKECTDGGIRERIEAWIKAETQKLEFDRSTKRSNE